MCYTGELVIISHLIFQLLFIYRLCIIIMKTFPNRVYTPLQHPVRAGGGMIEEERETELNIGNGESPSLQEGTAGSNQGPALAEEDVTNIELQVPVSSHETALNESQEFNI